MKVELGVRQGIRMEVRLETQGQWGLGWETPGFRKEGRVGEKG